MDSKPFRYDLIHAQNWLPTETMHIRHNFRKFSTSCSTCSTDICPGIRNERLEWARKKTTKHNSVSWHCKQEQKVHPSTRTFSWQEEQAAMVAYRTTPALEVNRVIVQWLLATFWVLCATHSVLYSIILHKLITVYYTVHSDRLPSIQNQCSMHAMR